MTALALQYTPMQRTSLGRLTSVEVRKSLDTRSGRWLMGLAIVFAIGAAALGALTGSAAGHDFEDVLGVTTLGAAVLVPIVGILLVTSEWSQRTALATFTLTPRRGRVVAAKICAGVLIGLGVGAAVATTSVVATLVASHPQSTSGVWSGALPLIAGAIGFQIVNMLFGVALGLLMQNSPLAIVSYFVVTTSWSLFGTMIPAIEHVQPWLNTLYWLGLMSAHIPGDEWAHMGTAFAFWVVLLGAIGAVRIMRRATA